MKSVQPLISKNLLATPKDTEEAPTLKSIPIVICPRDPVHCERSLASPATRQTGSIEGFVASRQTYVVVVSSCPRRLRQEDSSVRESQALCRFTCSPAARWVVGVVNTLRTGSQTEVLLEVIDALLDNSTLFVEQYVSYPADRLLSLTRPPSAAPTPTTRLVYSTPFIATAHTLDAPTYLGGANGVAAPDTKFHNVSFSSPHHEDPDPGAGFDR